MANEFDVWCIVELMGHTMMAGRVTEENRFGSVLGRCDIPCADGTFTTVYFNAANIYRLTPTTEEVARAAARSSRPEPIHRWELPAPERGDEDHEDEFDPYG